jgi:predicted acetyltransferase
VGPRPRRLDQPPLASRRRADAAARPRPHRLLRRPWKRRLGHATRALALILPEARARGLAFVELTTEPGNTASQRTIEKNGGRLVERFQKAPAYGGGPSLRYRIDL